MSYMKRLKSGNSSSNSGQWSVPPRVPTVSRQTYHNSQPCSTKLAKVIIILWLPVRHSWVVRYVVDTVKRSCATVRYRHQQ